MRIKKHLLLYIIIALIACLTVIILLSHRLFSSRPIIEYPNTNSVVSITYNPYLNQNINMDSFVEIAEYDEEKILACLSRYNEKKLLRKATGYWLGGVEIEILIQTDTGLKIILLGNKNYSYESIGESEYKILYADILRLELLEILDIDTVYPAYRQEKSRKTG